MRIHIRRRSTTFRSGVQRTTITEGGCLTIQHCARNLHFVVEKGIERDLWGCLRVRLWPCDIQDERVAVFKVSYLLYYIKIQGKTRNYTRINPDSLVKVIKWTNILRVSWFNLMLCPVETELVMNRLGQNSDTTHSKLKGNWTDFLETLIPFIDGKKSLQLHLWL